MLKTIYSSLNNLNSSQKSTTNIIDNTLGVGNLKSSVWHEVLRDGNMFTASLKQILIRLENIDNGKLISRLFEKMFYAIVKDPSETISLFHFHFIFNLMEQVGVVFLNKMENPLKDESTPQSIELIGDYVYSSKTIKWNNSWLNRVILIDLIENLRDSSFQKSRFYAKLGNENRFLLKIKIFLAKFPFFIFRSLH